MCSCWGVVDFEASWLGTEGIELVVGPGMLMVWTGGWRNAGHMKKAPSLWGMGPVRKDWVCVR